MKKRSNILIVDDHPTNIEILEETLVGYNLIVAMDGETALRLALKHQPDLILLDIMMPGMDGYEVCREIRKIPKLKFTKIIIISAKAMLAERLKGYEVGADDYITKPFEEEEILAKIRVHLKLRFIEEVDNLKKDLLSLLCHETNTPLSNILGPLDLLFEDDDEMTRDERHEWYKVIRNGANQLHNLFQKVLTLSLIKSGQSTFDLKTLDIGSAIETAVAQIDPKAEGKNLTVVKNMEKDLVCRYDFDHMVTVFCSILDNAINVSPNDSMIAIDVKLEQNDIHILIKDQGTGIDEKYLSHIFDEFTHKELIHHSEGQGLSLAIAKQIIAIHEGSIEVINNEDKGVTFIIKLPLVFNK